MIVELKTGESLGEGYFDFRQPDLSTFEATDAERETAAKFTRIRRIVVDGTPEAHTTWLVIGNQSFRLDDYRDTPEEASWLCWMLAKALINVKTGAV